MRLRLVHESICIDSRWGSPNLGCEESTTVMAFSILYLTWGIYQRKYKCSVWKWESQVCARHVQIRGLSSIESKAFLCFYIKASPIQTSDRTSAHLCPLEAVVAKSRSNWGHLAPLPLIVQHKVDQIQKCPLMTPPHIRVSFPGFCG